MSAKEIQTVGTMNIKNKQLTEKDILEKYPKIFKDRNKPMTETCMCWGLEVPDAWLLIIDDLCDAMTNCTYAVYNSQFGAAIEFPQVVAEQVKSKFGQLRFYFRLEYKQENVPDSIQAEHHKYIDGMIAYAQNKIYKLKNEI